MHLAALGLSFNFFFGFEYGWRGTLGFDTIDNTLVFAFIQDILASTIERVLNRMRSIQTS